MPIEIAELASADRPLRWRSRPAVSEAYSRPRVGEQSYRAELRSAPSDSSTGLSTTEFNDGSLSGQLGDDRSERISGVGADNEVGEAAVLPPPQDLLGGR